MSRSAAEFHRLHHEPSPLLLANCWDAGSARLISSCGAKAIASTSAGIAWSHGYADGDTLPVDRLLATVGAIARVIEIPLTVDLEGGYSEDPIEVGQLVARVIDAGAVGINLEDGRGTPALLSAKIRQIRTVANRAGVALFVNARTDVYLKSLVPEAARVEETLSRARLYRDAGADGIFVPGLLAAPEIQAIAGALGLPLNLLTRPRLAPVAELARLGVRRLSVGSAIPQMLWSQTARLARAFLADGRSEPLADGATPHAEINAFFASK